MTRPGGLEVPACLLGRETTAIQFTAARPQLSGRAGPRTRCTGPRPGESTAARSCHPAGPGSAAGGTAGAGWPPGVRAAMSAAMMRRPSSSRHILRYTGFSTTRSTSFSTITSRADAAALNVSWPADALSTWSTRRTRARALSCTVLRSRAATTPICHLMPPAAPAAKMARAMTSWASRLMICAAFSIQRSAPPAGRAN